MAHQHTIRKEMQILFEEEKGSLEDQHKRDQRALSDMEERMQVIRRREQELKDELAEVIILFLRFDNLYLKLPDSWGVARCYWI